MHLVWSDRILLQHPSTTAEENNGYIFYAGYKPDKPRKKSHSVDFDICNVSRQYLVSKNSKGVDCQTESHILLPAAAAQSCFLQNFSVWTYVVWNKRCKLSCKTLLLWSTCLMYLCVAAVTGKNTTFKSIINVHILEINNAIYMSTYAYAVQSRFGFLMYEDSPMRIDHRNRGYNWSKRCQLEEQNMWWTFSNKWGIFFIAWLSSKDFGYFKSWYEPRAVWIEAFFKNTRQNCSECYSQLRTNCRSSLVFHSHLSLGESHNYILSGLFKLSQNII